MTFLTFRFTLTGLPLHNTCELWEIFARFMAHANLIAAISSTTVPTAIISKRHSGIQENVQFMVK
jgi:hypothetical protein